MAFPTSHPLLPLTPVVELALNNLSFLLPQGMPLFGTPHVLATEFTITLNSSCRI